MRSRLGSYLAAALLAVACLTANATVGAQATTDFNLPAQPLADSLRAVAGQTNSNILFDRNLVQGISAKALKAQLSVDAALKALLEGTGLTYKNSDDKTVMIVLDRPASSATTGSATLAGVTHLAQNETPSPETGEGRGEVEKNQAQTDPSSSSDTKLEEVSISIPEILVTGSKILNTDIRRTREDAQPYVILDRATIEQSGATNLDDFLKQRLTTNTTSVTGAQSGSVNGSRSEINLRGLGANETLILIDGRRAIGVSVGGPPAQPDLNGIPLAAIERIEVLPSTASGIYGGSATGGVVNVVMRRDYAGGEASVTYENTFHSNSALRRVYISKGFNFGGGSTNLLLAGTYSKQDELASGEREFDRRGIGRVLSNNPDFFTSLAAPPLGSTTNIRSVDGSNLILDDGTPLDAPNAFVPQGYAGVASDVGAALIANVGEFNFESFDSAQSFGGKKRALLTEPTLKSLQATLRQRFGQRVNAFFDVSGSENTSRFAQSGLDFGSLFPEFVTIDSGAPNNPFQQTLSVTVPSSAGDSAYEVDTQARRVATGVIVELPRHWVFGADYTWNRSSLEQRQPSSAFDGLFLIIDGSLDVLRDPSAYEAEFAPFVRRKKTSPQRSTMRDANLRLSGPVWTLPGGEAMLTALLERREDAFGDGEGREFEDSGPGTPFVETARLLEKTQDVDSAYLELRLPFISASNALRAVRGLELQLAARHDSYETDWSQARLFPGSADPILRGSSKLNSTDPTVGLRYEANESLMLRASYGTGFLPPSVADFSAVGPFPDGVFDSRRGEFVGVLATFGGNPNLQPEESESWSAGVVFKPSFWRGVRLSIDYTTIDKSDNILQFETAQQVVDREDVLGDRIVRGTPEAGQEFGPILAVDATALNVSQANVEAFDIAFDYVWETAHMGAFDFAVLATRQTHFETRLTPSETDPLIENVGVTSSNPLKFKANSTLRWRYRDWIVGWSARYFDSYIVSRNPLIVANQGGTSVPSQTYHDLFATYRLQTRFASLDSFEIQAGIKNVFDKKPPFDASASANGYYSLLSDPRLSSYYLSVKVGF